MCARTYEILAMSFKLERGKSAMSKVKKLEELICTKTEKANLD